MAAFFPVNKHDLADPIDAALGISATSAIPNLLCGRPQVGNTFPRNFLRFFAVSQDTHSDAGRFVQANRA
jgi:hypothetical protein